MGDIRSAREIAMEKLENLDEVTEEERLEWKYVPEGEKLAAKYLKKDYDLAAELSRYEEKARRYALQGAGEILVRNIDLPKSDLIRKNSRRAMDGLKAIKTDKVSVENVYSKMRRIFSHYVEQGEQQRKQAYEQLKAEFEAKMQQAIQQQLGSSMGVKIDVERQPQFQEEWRMIQAQLDLQYVKLFDEYKHELLAIP
jgi:heme oxygenase